MTLPIANSTTNHPQRLRAAVPIKYTGQYLKTAAGTNRAIREVLIEGTGVTVNVPSGIVRINKPVDKFGVNQSGWKLVEQGKYHFFRDYTTNGSVASRSLMEAITMLYQIADQPLEVVNRTFGALKDREYLGKNVNTGLRGIEAVWSFLDPKDTIPALSLRFRTIVGGVALHKSISVSLSDTVGLQVAMEKLVTLRDNTMRMRVQDKKVFKSLWTQIRTGTLRGNRVHLPASFWNQLMANRNERIEARAKKLRGL